MVVRPRYAPLVTVSVTALVRGGGVGDRGTPAGLTGTFMST